MACAWGGFAGYATAMLLSYFVGQKYYPINYPIREIMTYVGLAFILSAAMLASNKYLEALPAIGVNTLLGLVFIAYLVKKDFPVGKFLKHKH